MTYVVKSGDTMYEIAKKFGVPLAALIAANPQIKDPNCIYPGQVLNVPVTHVPAPPPMPGWCTLVLTPVHPKVEPGCALVRQHMPHIMVALMDMPDPSTWTDCNVYTAWVMDDAEDPVVLFWFNLLPVGRGFWINHHSPRALSMREDVVVTAEEMGHPNTPCGTRILHGNLRHCCRRDP